MNVRRLVGAAVAAIVLLGPQAAWAVPGWATSSVPLWRDPLNQSRQLALIPAGAPVEVYRCGHWCEVTYGAEHGWAAADAIVTPDENFQPAFVSPFPGRDGEVRLQPIYVPPAPAYLASTAGQPCVSLRPCRDTHYGSWYAGKTFYFNGRFVDRPDVFAIVGR